MTDFATALRARLIADAGVSALVGTRIFPMIRPQDSALPAVRYQVISDPRPEHLKGYDGARSSRVQYDCFAETYLGARALANAVIAALALPAIASGVTFGRGKAEGPRDGGEDVAGGKFIYRAIVDLIVEHRLSA